MVLLWYLFAPEIMHGRAPRSSSTSKDGKSPYAPKLCRCDVKPYRTNNKLTACMCDVIPNKKKKKTSSESVLHVYICIFQYAPAESLSDLSQQVLSSPAKNYLMGVLMTIIGIIFIVGITCGRVTKRVTREQKTK
jgi:hypothetical protein